MRKTAARTAVALAMLLVATGDEAPALDLPGALREVAAANPTLAGRREMVEAARRRIAPAGAWSSPMLEVGVLNVPTNGRFDMDPMTMKMIGIEQRLPLFGANGLARRSARAAAAAEGAGLETMNYELFAMAWESYADAYHADRLVALNQSHHGEMDRLARAARARYDAGGGRLDDVLRAEAEQARTLVDRTRFAAEALGARARLAALMGRPAAALEEALDPPPSSPVPDAPDSILARVNERHPRLREIRARTDRYRFAARAARRMSWPDLQLGVSYGFREPVMDVEQDDMWSATVGFMLPLFAGQREFSEGREMDAMARASEHDLLAATLELEQQARSLHALARANERTVALLADTVLVVQRRAAAASWAGYTAGRTDLWRVLEATHAVYGEEIALERARQERSRIEARLFAVTAHDDRLGLALPGIPRSEP